MSGIKSTANRYAPSSCEIIYRVDGGALLGMGHIYKGLILERELTAALGHPSPLLFLIREDDRGYQKLMESDVSVERIPPDLPLEEEMGWLLQKMGGRRKTLLILDILDVSENCIKKARKVFEGIITMENLGSGASLSDVVINAIVEGLESRLELRNGTKYFLGGDYKILNEHFDHIKRKKTDAFKLVISLGGGDCRECSSRVLDALREISPEVEIDLVFGPGVTRSEIDENDLLQTFPSLKVLYDVPHMAQVLAGAELTITAAGGTLYEICRVGVPGVVISLVPHQERNARFFEEKGCVVNVGSVNSSFEKKLADSVHMLIADSVLRSKMSRAGRKLIDGKGRQRVVHIIREMLS